MSVIPYRFCDTYMYMGSKYETQVFSASPFELAGPCLTAAYLQEAALRWVIHHSTLRNGDTIIIGAKRGSLGSPYDI